VVQTPPPPKARLLTAEGFLADFKKALGKAKKPSRP
jgi:hypothetical protein